MGIDKKGKFLGFNFGFLFRREKAEEEIQAGMEAHGIEKAEAWKKRIVLLFFSLHFGSTLETTVVAQAVVEIFLNYFFEYSFSF